MPDIIHRARIAKAFGSASRSYDVSARLQRYSGKHLMPWLPNRNDLNVLDLGSGTGFFTDILATRYELVMGLDISTKMLKFAQESRSKEIAWLEGDAFKLPLQNNTVDLIYSNLVIQWCEPLDLVMKEVFRVLKPGGLFIFTTLVDGTLFELKSSWAQVDDDKHVIDFKTDKEMTHVFHDLNAKLLEHNVQDVILEYENVLHLVHELKGLGATRVAKKQNKGLGGRDKWKQMTENYKDFLEPNDIYPATYRVYSGMAVKLNN